jgi:NO-binding membrane sensor protein with MHYT domain
MASIVATNIMVFFAVHLSCDPVLNPGILLASLVWCGTIGYISLFLLFHLRITQFRFIGAFITGLAILGFHFIAMIAIEFRFNNSNPEPQL